MKKDDFNETMSLSDILDEVGGFELYEETDDSLDEILVEFSDMPDAADKEKKNRFAFPSTPSRAFSRIAVLQRKRLQLLLIKLLHHLKRTLMR